MAYIDTVNLESAFVGASELQSIWVGSIKVWEKAAAIEYVDTPQGGTQSGWLDSGSKTVYSSDYTFNTSTGYYVSNSTATTSVSYATMASNPNKQYFYTGYNTQQVGYYQYYDSQSVAIYTYSTWERTEGTPSITTGSIYASASVTFSSTGVTGGTKATRKPSASIVGNEYYIVSSSTVYSKYTCIYNSTSYVYQWLVQPYTLSQTTLSNYTTKYNTGTWQTISGIDYYIYARTDGSKTQYKITTGTRKAVLKT